MACRGQKMELTKQEKQGIIALDLWKPLENDSLG